MISEKFPKKANRIIEDVLELIAVPCIDCPPKRASRLVKIITSDLKGIAANVRECDRVSTRSLAQTIQLLADCYSGGGRGKSLHCEVAMHLRYIAMCLSIIATRAAATEGIRKSRMTFVTPRRKPLAEVTGEDVPPGLDPEDVATDCPERPWR